jgi:hypothetical protein
MFAITNWKSRVSVRVGISEFLCFAYISKLVEWTQHVSRTYHSNGCQIVEGLAAPHLFFVSSLPSLCNSLASWSCSPIHCLFQWNMKLRRENQSVNIERQSLYTDRIFATTHPLDLMPAFNLIGQTLYASPFFILCIIWTFNVSLWSPIYIYLIYSLNLINTWSLLSNSPRNFENNSISAWKVYSLMVINIWSFL